MGVGWHVLTSNWLVGGSYLGGLQHLDVLGGSIALIVLSSNHIVVSPDRKQEACSPNVCTSVLPVHFDDIRSLN